MPEAIFCVGRPGRPHQPVCVLNPSVTGSEYVDRDVFGAAMLAGWDGSPDWGPARGVGQAGQPRPASICARE
jgi:hypothetical protein